MIMSQIKQSVWAAAAILLSLFLVAMLPVPVFDACGIVPNWEEASWYYCKGGYMFCSGLLFSLCTLMFGPRSKRYHYIAVLLIIAFSMMEWIRVGMPVIEGLFYWVLSPTMLGSLLGAVLGFVIIIFLNKANLSVFVPNKANQSGTP